MARGKVLVAYSTKGGTTEEYAKAIASVLRDNNLQVDVVDLKRNSNPDLTQYQSLIVGSGVRMQRMHGDGRKFLEREFGERKVAVFLSSLEPKDEAIRKYIDPILRKNPKLKPVDIEVFGGRIRFLGKTIDKTDIGKAKEWAVKIAKSFKA
ncbi:MAG: flavodoxin domain-containing protein [Candidatus Bathyarchaeia archaeon]